MLGATAETGFFDQDAEPLARRFFRYGDRHVFFPRWRSRGILVSPDECETILSSFAEESRMDGAWLIPAMGFLLFAGCVLAISVDEKYSLAVTAGAVLLLIALVCWRTHRLWRIPRQLPVGRVATVPPLPFAANARMFLANYPWGAVLLDLANGAIMTGLAGDRLNQSTSVAWALVLCVGIAGGLRATILALGKIYFHRRRSGAGGDSRA